MGNSQSPAAADPTFTSATRSFSKQGLQDLHTLFLSLASQSKSNDSISPQVFQEFFRVPGPLGRRLFEVVGRKRKDERVTFEDLVISKAVYEKGTREEIDGFIYELCDVDGDGFVTRSDLEAVLTSIHNAIFSPEKAEPDFTTFPDTMEVFLKAATFSKEVEGAGNSMSTGDFKTWCSLLPSVRKFLGSLVMLPDSGRPGFQVPSLHHQDMLNPELLILSSEYAWHIGGALSHDELDEWKLLYHSTVNGLSFATFMGHISRGDGPTVLIIKDTEGYIYGGYASQPWEKHSDFYGDMKSYLFQLYPQASIYRPTGANKNLQWCAANYTSDSIPNGIGFGGKTHHFGLFVSANFDQGHTFSCTTFNSPGLSKNNRIRPEVIECWGVVLKGVQNEKSEALQGTVLDRFKEDRNMLKLVGLASSSE